MREHSRRAFVSITGLAMVAGCVSSGDEPTTDENSAKSSSDSENDSGSEDDTPERCNLRSGERQGRGESVSEVVELIVTDTIERDPFKSRIETENTNNLEEDSAGAAAQIAFRRLAAEFGVEMTESPGWISPAVSIGGEEVSPKVVVEAFETSHHTEGESYRHCPPAAYEFTKAVELVPSTATVTLQSPDGDELHEQEHEVYLEQINAHLD